MESVDPGESLQEECLTPQSASQRESSVPPGLSNLLPGQTR